MYNDTTPYTTPTAVDAYYAVTSTLTNVTWIPFPDYISASLVTYSTYKNIKIQGTFPKFTNDSSWISRPSSSTTSTVSAATYETVARPYYSAQQYVGDPTIANSVVLRFDAKNLGVVLATFYGSIVVRNNWTRKRNQVIPFVQGGSADVNTFRFPGGSLGGYVGQDLAEPPTLSGLVRVATQFSFTDPGTSGYVTVTPTVSSMTFRLQGGGGQGGAGYVTNTYSASGGGGGSGGYYETSVAVQTGQQIFYYIGAGGSADNDGRGGDTYIILPSGQTIAVGGGRRGGDGFLSTGVSFAAGGIAGGPVGNAGSRGTVATGSGADIPNQFGGRGGDAIDPNIGQGGAGGDYRVPTGATGQPGTGFGGGGGGGGTDRGTRGPWSGADGLGGRLTIDFFGNRYQFTDIVGANIADYNVSTRALAAGWDGQTPLQADITLLAGFYMYSTNTSTPGFNYDSLPAGTLVNLVNNGNILGMGGAGGRYWRSGENGGPAIVLNSLPLYVTNTGNIAGGGGGGAGGRLPSFSSEFFTPGGGGGAGGGNGGQGKTRTQFPAGGAGGGPGLAGANGGVELQTDGIVLHYVSGGGGGGRILPGTGGAGGTGSWLDANYVGARGGGSGGGGGSFGGYSGVTHNGGAGGSAGNVGNDGVTYLGDTQAGGGGGWGAAGGNASIFTGGVGGKAIETNGYDINFSSNTGTIYGLVGGSSTSRGFSTAIIQNTSNMVLRTYTISQGWDQNQTASVTIAGNTYVYSTSTGTPGLTIDGSWPNGVRLNNYGYIMGCGGTGQNFSAAGGSGGTALSIFLDIKLLNAGAIAGGGGGGGGNNDLYTASAGGGGAGGGLGGNGSVPSGSTGNAAGGLPGQVGATGAYTNPTGFAATGGGGGGGRIIPGTGGAGGIFNVIPLAGVGGGAGGGGGAFFWNAIYTANFGNGNPGGSANNAAAGPSQTGGGGGGGWGAAGGAGFNYTAISPPGSGGGAGGKGISLNGKQITYFSVGTIYGAIS